MDENIKIAAESVTGSLRAIAYRIGNKDELFYQLQDETRTVHDIEETPAVFFAGFIAATNARKCADLLDPQPTEPQSKELA